MTASDVLFPMVDEAEPESQGVVSTWFADDGGAVHEGQLIAEVQVAKMADEIYSPATGTLRHAVGEGEVIVQGAVVAHIE